MSTIKVLEPLNAEISSMSNEQAKALKLPKEVHVLHLKHIQRLYGEQGAELVDLLKKHPAMAVCLPCAFWSGCVS